MSIARAIFVLIVVVNIVKADTPNDRPPLTDGDLDKAIHDRRYLTRQLKCTIGEAPCDAVGKRLKSLAPLILRGSCPQCTQQETRQIQKVLAHVQKNYPKEWNKILQRNRILNLNQTWYGILVGVLGGGVIAVNQKYHSRHFVS